RVLLLVAQLGHRGSIRTPICPRDEHRVVPEAPRSTAAVGQHAQTVTAKQLLIGRNRVNVSEGADVPKPATHRHLAAELVEVLLIGRIMPREPCRTNAR